MRFGEYELTIVSGGRFRIDGGTMFGVVPKSLWERVTPADDRNLTPQATNCLLLRKPGRTILIDTGYGSKLPTKFRAHVDAEPGDPLAASLSAAGVTPERIDLVLLTHLHFDHAGGATVRDEGGAVVPRFPNAEYVVRRGEYEIAAADLPELRGSYTPDDFRPLAASGRLRLIDGDVEVAPGVTALATGGHTAHHQAFVIDGGDREAVYLSDICPTTHHLRTAWCMGYDLDQYTTRRVKRSLLGRIARDGALAIFDHDAAVVAATIRTDPLREFVVGEAFASL